MFITLYASTKLIICDLAHHDSLRTPVIRVSDRYLGGPSGTLFLCLTISTSVDWNAHSRDNELLRLRYVA